MRLLPDVDGSPPMPDLALSPDALPPPADMTNMAGAMAPRIRLCNVLQPYTDGVSGVCSRPSSSVSNERYVLVGIVQVKMCQGPRSRFRNSRRSCLPPRRSWCSVAENACCNLRIMCSLAERAECARRHQSRIGRHAGGQCKRHAIYTSDGTFCKICSWRTRRSSDRRSGGRTQSASATTLPSTPPMGCRSRARCTVDSSAEVHCWRF
jgi:hypothetical protein